MFKLIGRLLLALLGLLILAALIVPFLIPVPPLQDTQPVEELADPDSRFIEVNGLTIHYKMAVAGEPVFLLLHGFASSTFSWRYVMQPLSQYGTVIAYDRPAFGLTERPLKWEGANPYTPEAQTELVVGLLDQLGIDQAVLVGNSAGGTVAVYTALRHPERVQALVLVDAAIYSGGGSPDWIKPLLKTPQMRRLGPLVARRLLSQGESLLELAWHDPARAGPDLLEGYSKPSKVENWDKALWELTLASRSLHLPERLGEIRQPTLVITGDDDRIVPTEESIRLSKELPGAALVVIANCGHTPQEECPEPFLRAVLDFIQSLRLEE